MADFFAKAFGHSEGRYEDECAWFQKQATAGAGPYHTENLFFFTTPDQRGLQAGSFETPTVAMLRSRAAALGLGPPETGMPLQHTVGNVATLHDFAESGAVFQAASQFNCLEMVSPAVTPEHGITCYRNDHTQGPACAIACPAGTAARNYCVHVSGRRGQSAQHQLNTLAGCAAVFGETPWTIKNGYLDATEEQLLEVGRRLEDPATRQAFIDALQVGVQWDTEVVGQGWAPRPLNLSVEETPRHLVTQVYSSAAAVGYSRTPIDAWAPLATAILEATYEATIHVGAIVAAGHQRAGRPAPDVFLTAVGGGVFANEPDWINTALRAALRHAHRPPTLVHYGSLDKDYWMPGDCRVPSPAD